MASFPSVDLGPAVCRCSPQPQPGHAAGHHQHICCNLLQPQTWAYLG